MGRYLFLLCLLLSAEFFGQDNLMTYTELQEKYASLEENDEQALPLLRKSIKLAKTAKNYRHLTYTYEDAVYYSASKVDKLKYADSTISASLKTADSALISKSYLGKGIVYYFNYKNYDKALHQYLLAYSYAENTSDLYLLNKIKYHIGVVKSYLGYHQEAISFFMECNLFFRNNLDPKQHPNAQFNFRRGYLNTIHQLLISYRHLKKWEKVDSLLYITVPYRRLPEFRQEKGYFMKEQGILSYTRNSYPPAIDTLLGAAEIIKEKKELTPLAVVCHYTGKSYLKLGDTTKAMEYFLKVDSLFTENKIIFPELRQTYEIMLKNTNITLHPEEALYYTAQILKVDSILSRDVPHLSSMIFREYDTKKLLAERARILKLNKGSNILVKISIIVVALLCILLLIFFRHQKWKDILTFQPVVWQKSPVLSSSAEREEKKVGRKLDYNAEVVEIIMQKLLTFENNRDFIKKDLTLRKVATSFKTNTTHLSYVINEYKHMNFNTYLKVLRINYITQLMQEDKKYLNYTIEALADCCGMNSRQQFSNQFYEMNGQRPIDFINLRKEELQKN